MQGVWFSWGSQEEMDSRGLVAGAAGAGSLPGFTRDSPTGILARLLLRLPGSERSHTDEWRWKAGPGSVRVSVYWPCLRPSVFVRHQWSPFPDALETGQTGASGRGCSQYTWVARTEPLDSRFAGAVECAVISGDAFSSPCCFPFFRNPAVIWGHPSPERISKSDP